jgi:hypothetical protein
MENEKCDLLHPNDVKEKKLEVFCFQKIRRKHEIRPFASRHQEQW